MESDKTGYLSLSSVDSDNNLLSGVTFGIYSDEDCTEVVGDFVIIENEPITIELLVGTYYVKVVEVPKDYKLNETVYTVEIVEDEISELVVSIELGTGYLSLSATDSNGAVVSGVVLGVYLDENCTELVVDPVTITNDAVVVELEVGTYYVKEIEVPEKYVLSNSTYSVDVVNNDTIELVVNIAYLTFNLTIAKTVSGDSNGVTNYNFTATLDNGKSETFDVSDGESYEIKDIIVGTGYTITENTVGADTVTIVLNGDDNDSVVATFDGPETVAEYSSTITEDDTLLKFVNNYRAYFPVSVSFDDDPLDRGAVSFTVNGEEYSVDENSSIELSFKEGAEVTIVLNDTENYSFTVNNDDTACTEYSTVVSEPIYIYISE